MAACSMGDIDTVSSLIARGAKLNEVEKQDGWNALCFATAFGHYEIVMLLLEQKDADIQVIDEYGHSLLHMASSEGRVDLVKLFLQKGVDPSLEDVEGNTALTLAENTEVFDILEHVRTMSLMDHGEKEQEKKDLTMV